MIPNIKKLLIGAGVILLLLLETTSLFAQAGGALMVNPKRIVFEANKRNDVVTLYNEGDDTTSYVIAFKHYEMQQNGEFKDIDSIKTNELFCDSLIRFFPKEVTLNPHSAQTVRLQLMKPKDLPAGEYRSHLFFRGIERAKALENVPIDTSKKIISLSLKATYGLAIPIIVRNATTPAFVTMTNLQLSPADSAGNSHMTVDINRIGNQSSYGELVVTYSDVSTKDLEVGRVKGVGVYVPLPMRRFPLQVKLPAITSLSTGKLHIEYLTMTGEAKETVIASADLALKK